MSGGDLALGVADHRCRAYPAGFPEPCEGDHHREEGRLDHLDAIDRCRPLLAQEHVFDREVQEGGEGRLALIQGAVEDRRGAGELRRHPLPLGALAGEEEDRGLALAGHSPDQAGGIASRGQGIQGAEQLGALCPDRHRALLEGRAGGGERVGDVGGIELGVVPQPRGQALCRLAQGRLGLGRERQGDLAGEGRLPGGGAGAPRPLPATCCGGLWRLLQDQVGVGAADAEGGDPGAPWMAVGLPLDRFAQQLDLARLPVDLGGGLLDVQRLWQDALAHRQHHLDHAADPGCGLGVADVGLQRAQLQRRLAILAVGGEQGAGLDRVAEGGTGAVGLDRVDVGGLQTGVGEGLADHPFLGGAVGGGEAVGGAVLVDRRAADRRQDRVAVCLRLGEALEHEHADALRPGGAIGPLGEGLAAPVGSKAALAAKLGEHSGAAQHRHPSRQGEAALAPAQRPRRQVHRHQRGGAGGVDRHRRALQAERVGDPSGDDAGEAPGQAVALHLALGSPQAGAVVLGADADEDAGLGATKGAGVDSAGLQRLPGAFEQQPLLGVHRQRLARADAEELGVEVGGVVEEAALADVAGAGMVGVGVVEALEVPAAVLGKAGDRVATLGDQLPEPLRAACPTRIATGHADDRDRLVAGADGDALLALGDSGRPPGQVASQRPRGGMVEHDRRRQAQAGRDAEPIAQLDRAERVQSQLLEGNLGRHLLGGAVAEDRGRLGADQGQGSRRIELAALLGLIWRQRRRRIGIDLLGGEIGRRREVDPVALPLEGVGGKGNAPRLSGDEEGIPVELGAVDVGGCDRRDQGLRLGAALAQERGEGERRLLVLQAGRGHPREHRVGAKLEEDAGALGAQGADALGEPHRLTHVGHPVGGVGGLGRAKRLAAQVGDDRDLRLAVGERACHPLEALEHRLHQGRVKGVRDRQALGLPALPLPVRSQPGDGLLGAGDDDRAGGVDRGDRKLPLAPRDHLADLGLGGLDREHRPARWQLAHQGAPGGDQLGRVLEREDLADVGGGDLPDRVPGEQVGGEAERFEQAKQRHLDRKEGRLGVGGVVEQLPGLRMGAEDDLLERRRQLLVEELAGSIEGIGVGGVGRVELPAHPDSLGALAAEEVGEAGRAGLPPRGGGRGGAAGKGFELTDQLRAGAPQDDGALGHLGPGGKEGIGDVPGGQLGVVDQVGGEASGRLAQGRLRFGREGEGSRGREGSLGGCAELALGIAYGAFCFD